jgi:tetratricopeptide (TPR) repeat protein
MIRNWYIVGVPTPTSAHGGINFYIGNNESATGFFTPPLDMPPLPGLINLEIPRRVAEAQTGLTGMTDSEVSSYWFQKGLTFVRKNPGSFVRLTLRKTRAFLNAYEVPANIDPHFLREISTVLKIAFVGIGIVLPLGLLGMLHARRKWRIHLPIYLFFVSYSISVILFFINDRYRIPIVPVLLVYAGYSVRVFIGNLRRIPVLALHAVALLLLVLLVNTNLGIRPNPALVAHARGFVLASMTRPHDAIAYYRKALRLNPNLGLTHRQLAGLLASEGDTATARRHYEAALRFFPKDSTLLEEWALFRRRAGLGDGETPSGSTR